MNDKKKLNEGLGLCGILFGGIAAFLFAMFCGASDNKGESEMYHIDRR